ncbi:MAG: hypothetical protein KDN18_25660 [Verrucomicrobiae bacterium]|nr:hypothetical protein [Verrucomicrobiae bacterium]
MAIAEKLKSSHLSGAYRTPFVLAVVFQVVALIFTSFLFDLGVAFTIATISLIPFWIVVLIIVFRRPQNPTGFDRSFIAYGYPILMVALLTLNSFAQP